MLILVLLTLGLTLASYVLMYLLHRSFVRGISWFDERETQREQRERRERAARRRLYERSKSARHPAIEKNEEEWAEIIDG